MVKYLTEFAVKVMEIKNIPLHKFEEPREFSRPDTLNTPFEIARIDNLTETSKPAVPHRHNYYKIFWILGGSGAHYVDFDEYRFAPEIYTDKIDECQHFYCNYLGFVVKKKLEGFVVLRHTQNPEYEIMFCIPNSRFVNEIFHPQFKGQGLIFQMEVTDIDAEYKRFKKFPVTIALELIEEEVSGRHFTIRDPNGILIDIVQFI